MLFVLGGNGTHAGANAIHNEVATYLKKKFETFEQSFCFDLPFYTLFSVSKEG